MQSQFKLKEDGFTLIEIMVAVMIMTIGLFAIITVFSSALLDTITDQTRSNALKIAEKDIEYARGLDYNQIGILGAASPDPIGILTASQLVTSADSRFKFVGNREYTLTRQIVWVDEPSDATADQDYKRFKVTVTWDTPNPGGSVSLTSDFQPTSVTTSLNQAPIIQFLDPQQNNTTQCGDSTFEVYAVDPEDLDDLTVSIVITNPSYPDWVRLLASGDYLSSYDITFDWDTSTVTDDATAYNLLAIAADTSSKLNSTSRTIFLDNQPAGWTGGAIVNATYDGTEVDISWNAATNVPPFFEYTLHRRDLTTSTDVTFGPYASGVSATSDSTVLLGHQYEYVLQTSNACGITSASSQDAGGIASVTIPASVNYNLNTTFTGTGSIDVQYAGSPGPCNVGAGCNYSIPAGTAVSLVAYPGAGYNFTSWATGPCAATATNPCDFNIGVNTSASTNFSLTPPILRNLSVTSGTGGSVLIQITGSADSTCPAASICARNGIPTSTEITLTANPASGFGFVSWSAGAPCDSSTITVCSFSITADTSKTASFTLNTPPVWNAGYPRVRTSATSPTDPTGNNQIVLDFRATDTTATNLTYAIRYCVKTNNGNCQDNEFTNSVPDQVVANNVLGTFTHTGLINTRYYTYRIRVCDDTSPTPLCNPTTSSITTWPNVTPTRVNP